MTMITPTTTVVAVVFPLFPSYSQKSLKFVTPNLHLASPIMVSSSKFVHEIWYDKPETVGVKRLVIHLAVMTLVMCMGTEE